MTRPPRFAGAEASVCVDGPMIKGFKDFLLRGNVVDLAVAVVIGTAFTLLVASFTDSFLEPLIGLIGGGGVDGGSFSVNSQVFTWGAFLNQVITFVLTAAVVYFVVVLPMKALMERRKRGEEAGPAEPTQVELLVEIRDLLRAQQGVGAGADPSGPGTTTLPGQL
jgi:large conductance mechanosensitive channel